MHIICLFKIDVIPKKKMVAEDQVAVAILCFVLVWFWRRFAQRHSAVRARDAAARNEWRLFGDFRRMSLPWSQR